MEEVDGDKSVSKSGQSLGDGSVADGDADATQDPDSECVV